MLSNSEYGIIVSRLRQSCSNKNERVNTMKNLNTATIESNIRRLKGGIISKWATINPAGNKEVSTELTLEMVEELQCKKDDKIVILYSHEMACDLRERGFKNVTLMVDSKDFNESHKAKFEENGGYSYAKFDQSQSFDFLMGYNPMKLRDGSGAGKDSYEYFGKALKMAKKIALITPLNLDVVESGEKLKHKNLVIKHNTRISREISREITDATNEMFYVIADSKTANEVPVQSTNKFHGVATVYPERARCVAIRGRVQHATIPVLGEKISFANSVNKDGTLGKLIEEASPVKFSKTYFTTKKFAVVIGKTVLVKSGLKTTILEHDGTVAINSVSIEADTREEAEKIQAHFKTPVMVQLIHDLLAVRGNTASVSKEMIEQCPTYA